ncbi:hypothetical protein T484DRAFT_1908371 [Baffinella frigidus]|nr:hypothetical protein T484DRAFT_1908371 [Cryptophyta sp. CCMP2293]
MGADGIPQLANSIWRVPGEKRVDDEAYTAAYREVGAEFHVDDEAYMAAYREVGAEFHVKKFYQFEQIPEWYVVLHVRGGDKRAAAGRSFCTDEVLGELLECGVAVVAVSDDAEMLGAFRARHPGIIAPPHHTAPGLPKLEMEMRDLSLLTRAAGILQHSSEGYSAFGIVAAMAKGILLLNTDRQEEDEDGLPNKILLFRAEGGGPQNLLSCAAEGDAARFIDALDCAEIE